MDSALRLMKSPLPFLLIVTALVFSDWAARAGGFTGSDIGAPSVPGSIQTNSTGAIILTGAGATLGLREDQAYFAWRQQDGDFDLAVRVESLNAPDLFGRAGLMARESLDTTSRFAGVFATPTV